MNTKILKGIISLIKFIITILVIIIVGIILVQRFSNNNISVMGYRIFTVVTESMMPRYKVGDVLLVKQKEITDIQVGDDVTYMGKSGNFANKIVTHQVINIESAENGKLEFTTKGIANDKEDPIVNEEQIYGVVEIKFKLITYLNGIISNMYGMYFLIIIPLAIIIFSEFKAFNKDDDEEDKDNKEIEEEKIDKKAKKRKEKRAKRRRKYE